MTNSNRTAAARQLQALTGTARDLAGEIRVEANSLDGVDPIMLGSTVGQMLRHADWLVSDAEEIRTNAVMVARENGITWELIAVALDSTRQRVWQKYHHLSSERFAAWPLPVGRRFIHENGGTYTVTRPGMIAGEPDDSFVFAIRDESSRALRVYRSEVELNLP